MTAPMATLTPLHYPNGSASYTSPTGEQVLASVNGPAEVSRRDIQNPEEATLEVLVKPGVGGSGVGERYVEGILRNVLSRVILMRDKAMARRGVVVTLVVLRNGMVDVGGKIEERGGSYLPILPALLHAALLSLLSAGIPMGMIYTATLVGISPSGEILSNLSASQVKSATSLHVLAFSSKGNLLLNESQGDFDLGTWQRVYDHAEGVCRGGPAGWVGKDGDVSMDEKGGKQTLEQFIREAVEDKAREEFAWKLAAA